MSNLSNTQHMVTVIQANGQSEFESVPIETIDGDSQLWQMLGLNAAQLTYFLEDEILENPFIELNYPREKRTLAAISLHEQEAIVGVDPQMPLAPQSLPMFLFEQIMMYRSTSIRDAMVRLIDLLDERGYLPYTYQELAQRLGIEEIVALDALTLFQQLEPAGIGAYDLRECLMIQTEQDEYAPNVAYYVLEEYFNQLVTEEYQDIVEASGLDLVDVMTCVNYYHTLRPSPADLFELEETTQLLPDVSVIVDETAMQVRYNTRYYPQIEFNQRYYDEMMATGEEEVTSYCQPYQFAYDRLAHNLAMREQLILKVSQAIAAVEYDYFTYQTSEKLPLLIKQITQLTGLPEPVVNLVVANKNIEVGQTVMPLVDFISVATQVSRDGFTAESIKQLIHEILHEHPSDLSDGEIVKLLEKQKIMMSEFMVRNYRRALGH